VLVQPDLSGVGIGGGVSPHFANADAQQHNDNAAAKNIIRNEELVEVMGR